MKIQEREKVKSLENKSILLSYIPNFQYFLSDAATEDEDRYNTSVVIKCWFMIVKYIKDPGMREKLFEIVKLLHDFLDQDEAIEYMDIFFKYLANTENSITRTDAVEAVETIFQGRKQGH
jgi:hypothetical protein